MNKRNFDKLRILKLNIALALVFILFLALIIRIGYLQVIRGEELKKSALSQSVKGIPIKPTRGIIYDRNGKKLVVNKVVYTAWIHTKEITGNKKESREERIVKIARDISEAINIDEGEVVKLLEENKGFRKLKENLSSDERETLEKLGIGAIQITSSSQRYYPYGNFASHLIGFTDSDNNGLYGVEKTYNKYLAGKEGKEVKVVDGSSRKQQLPFDGETIYEPVEGLSLILTLDERIQQLSERAVDRAMIEHEAKNITVLVMEPKTGDVLAMVNKPDYDLNNPREPLDENLKKEWEGLDEEQLQEKWFDLWRNYSINDIYEPGSTFKLITSAAALEENAVNARTPFYCNGYIRDIKGVTLKCASYLDPHRDLDFERGLATSCNIVFVNTARKLGKDKFYKYIRAFGFGSKTGIELNGEEYGIMYSLENIKDVELATMSYGHGIAMTPIQLVTAVSAISNGGNLMKPRLVKEIIGPEGDVKETLEPEIIRKVISKTTSETLLDLMETVVSKGGGKNAKIPGYKIGGKTGTALKMVDGVYVEGKYIGSFVAVAPTDDPKMVVLAIVDDPKGIYYGGTTAAPIAKEIIEGALDYLGIQPSEELQDKDDSNAGFSSVPDLRNKTIEEAGQILNDLSLKYMIEAVDVDENSIIVGQKPEPGITLNKGEIVDLFIEEKKGFLIPNLIGKTQEEIRYILEEKDIEYEIIGNGKCFETIPGPGEILSSGERLKIKLGE